MAGTTPLTNPINEDTPTPKAILLNVSTIGKSVDADIPTLNRKTINSPANPPKTERKTASNKN
ncbi:MAG: hypothetical protein KAH32_06840, partial [Chlamydiia bacterium]|nr:hypothetical protein [Chlamydiia bacterium]